MKQGLDEQAVRWTENWLNSRPRELSWRPVTISVHQGSILGPVLCNIFINDLQKLGEWLVHQRDLSRLRNGLEGPSRGSARGCTRSFTWDEQPHTPGHPKGHPALQQFGGKGPEDLGDTELKVSQQRGWVAKAAKCVLGCSGSVASRSWSDPSPLLITGEATQRVMCSVLGFPRQERWNYWEESSKGPPR